MSKPITTSIVIIISTLMSSLLLFIVVIAALFFGNTPNGSLGDTPAYINLLKLQSQTYGIPFLWSVADVTHESQGDWHAENTNTDGTEDAGLCQINTCNWPQYGLSDNPFDPVGNTGAGALILSTDLSKYGNIEDALYAYNAGTPQNGKLSNPSYYIDVSNIYNHILQSSIFASVHLADQHTVYFTVAMSVINSSTGETSDLVNPDTIQVTAEDKQNNTIFSTTLFPTTGDGFLFPDTYNLPATNTNGSPNPQGPVVYELYNPDYIFHSGDKFSISATNSLSQSASIDVFLPNND